MADDPDPTATQDLDPGDAFEQLMGSNDAPMYVLTAFDGRERSGCLVGFASQASIRPPRFLVMVSKANHTYGVALGSPVVVVHVLHAGDADLAARFGERSGDDVDKFDGLHLIDGPAGAPVLVGLDWFAGRVLRTVDCGDHVGLLLAPHDGVATRTQEPRFGLRDAGGMEPGHPA